MDKNAKARVETEIGSPEPNALYVLFDAPGGVLVENLAPLLDAIEELYRRLLILRLDDEVLRTLIERQSKDERLNGVSRSINARYAKAVLRPNEQIQFSRDAFRGISQRVYSTSIPAEGRLTVQRDETGSDALFVPTRIQIARSQISSPGLLELIGDPTTMQVLLALLGSLILLRGQDISRSIALRGQQPEIIRTLTDLGYSEEEVIAMRSYLQEDLDTLIDRLEAARATVAPGDEIDPTEE